MHASAVIFDMDGLLFDTEKLFLDQTKHVQKEIGFTIPHDLHMQAIGRTFPDVKRIFLDRLGPDFPMEEFMNKTKALVYQHIERYGIPVKPGALELLQKLKKLGLPRLLASSSPHWMIEKNLTASGLKPYFDLQVSGDDVLRGKPAPDIFLYAAKKSHSDPKRCVVLEDSNNGIRAAHAAGMRPVMIPDLKKPEPEVREMCFGLYESLLEVREDLEKITCFPSLSKLGGENWTIS